jgi:circadian clock protein KaiC
MAVQDKKDRCATGIPGFDNLCEGGLIRDSINLIIGNAGSGKTTFLLQFLYNGLTKFNENGIYVSFEQDAEDLYKTGTKLGMDFKKLDEDEKIKIIKFSPEMSIKDIQKELVKAIAKKDVKRICFDPINVFSLELPKEISLRKQLYDFLILMKKLDVCVVIAGESDQEDGEGKHSISDDIVFCKYLVDGVIEIFSSGISGTGDRAIRILKMRMTNHTRGPVGMEINSSGLKILKG